MSIVECEFILNLLYPETKEKEKQKGTTLKDFAVHLTNKYNEAYKTEIKLHI